MTPQVGRKINYEIWEIRILGVLHFIEFVLISLLAFLIEDFSRKKALKV